MEKLFKFGLGLLNAIVLGVCLYDYYLFGGIAGAMYSASFTLMNIYWIIFLQND